MTELITLIRDAAKSFHAWFDNDKRTTALACFLGMLITSQVNWSKVLAGDLTEVGKIIGAVVVVWQGYLTNRLPTIKP